LYGSLEKIAGRKDFRFDCDNQHQLFAGLRAQCPALDIPMRQMQTFSLVSTKTEEEVEPRQIEDGFNFGNDEKVIHIAPSTEGAWWYVLYFIIIAVISYAITRLTMPHMGGGNNAAGSRSTMFNGTVTQTDQGGPIQIPYGKKVLVGSQLIAADEDYFNLV
jgi:predicted phage tail protein